jgi:tetratricopeptide (TPR) repeat protein
MLRRLSCFSILVSILSAIVVAQRETDSSLPGSSFEISGQLRAAGGQKTVADVMVRVERFSGGIVDQIATDGTGKFRFSRLAPGQYIVSARIEGFGARTSQIDINRAIPRQYVVLQLQPDEATFRSKAPGVVDVHVSAAAREEFEKGQKALQDKRLDEAVARLENAARLSPAYFDAQVLLGSTHMDLKEWDRAERDLQRAIEIRPKESAPFILLGEVYRRQKKYPNAEKALVDGLRINKASWQGHFTLGRVYWEMGDVRKSAPHVGQAIELKPDHPEARLLAGNIFMRFNMPENALIEYEEYLRLAPDGEFANLTRENVQKLKKSLPPKR